MFLLGFSLLRNKIFMHDQATKIIANNDKLQRLQIFLKFITFQRALLAFKISNVFKVN